MLASDCQAWKGDDVAISKFNMGLMGEWQMSESAVKQLSWFQERNSEGYHEVLQC